VTSADGEAAGESALGSIDLRGGSAFTILLADHLKKGGCIE